jgi:N-acetyl-anhydromuramyl-L-alanine amidase AmpD
MHIEKLTTPNQNTGRAGGRTPDIIVCHITEGSFAGAVSWLRNPQAQASTHFVVARDGRITQLVNIADTAWGNGTTTGTDNRGNRHSRLAAVRDRGVNANSFTISIEHEGRLAETNGALAPAQLDATVWLIAHIRAEVRRIYGFEIPIDRDHIVGHADITPRWKPNCPGPDFPFAEIIARLQPAPAKKEDDGMTQEKFNEMMNVYLEQQAALPPSDWAKAELDAATKQGITDGTRPGQFATREQVALMVARAVKG